MANYQNITPVKLGQTAVTTAYTTLCTVPIGSRMYIKQLDICNTLTTGITVYVSLVPKAGTAGTTNAIFYNTTIPANTTVQWSGVQIMYEEETIQVKASVAGCTITASGGEAV